MTRWINCPYCGHRLFKAVSGDWRIEVKCPSCKKIYELTGGESSPVRIGQRGGEQDDLSELRKPEGHCEKHDAE